MEWHAVVPGFSPHHLVTAFPWDSGKKMTVVDVGGGRGHISRALVEHNPNVNCIVQDAPEIVVLGQEALVGTELKSRITFQAHDFFEEQPVKGADVYLLRLVLHDWSDKYATKIIQSLIPALKPGAKLVINERVIPARHQAHYLVEREARYDPKCPLLFKQWCCETDSNGFLHTGSDFDLYMLAFQNARERTAQDWAKLFEGADARFRLTAVHQPPKSTLAVVEMTWRGESRL
jgi:SAM-dependent methyltransferase